jgi:hypothetical protein
VDVGTAEEDGGAVQKNQKPLTIWQRVERYAPCVVRLLARKQLGRPLTDEEIAERSGLTVSHVAMLSQRTDWVGVDVPTMRKFLVGCGCDFTKYKQHKRMDCYLKSKPTFRYLRISKQWETLYQPLMAKWLEAKAKQLEEIKNAKKQNAEPASDQGRKAEREMGPGQAGGGQDILGESAKLQECGGAHAAEG